MSTDFELFPGKELSDLFKDIYSNQQSRKLALSTLISEIRKDVQTLNQWAMIGPLIKDLIESSVKNDDSLIKLATIAQRLISSSTNTEGEVGYLSDEEKRQLLDEVEHAVNNITTPADDDITKLTNDVTDMKKKLS